MIFNQETLLANSKKSFVKIEVLKKDYTVINNIEGILIGGSITIDANSDVRRTCSIQLVVNSADLYPTPGGQMFIDKLIKIYIGEQSPNSNEIIWINMGIYNYSDLNYSYSANDKSLSLTGLDLMSELTGARNGNIDALDITLETSRGLNISTVMRETLEQLTTFKEYNIDEIGSEYETKHSNYTGSAYTNLPYDITLSSGSTVYTILSELVNIYPNWEIYFDVDGVFHCHLIPDGQNEPNILDDTVLQDIVISESININMQEVYNKISVFGALLEPDDAISLENISYANEGVLTMASTDSSELYEASHYMQDQKMVSIEIPEIDSKTNWTNIYLADGSVYSLNKEYYYDIIKIDSGKCYLSTEGNVVRYIHYDDKGNIVDDNGNILNDYIGFSGDIGILNKYVLGRYEDGSYKIKDVNGNVVYIKKDIIVDGISWDYGANVILKNCPPRIMCGKKVLNYSGEVISEVALFNDNAKTITVIDGEVIKYNGKDLTIDERQDFFNTKFFFYDVKNQIYRLINKSNYMQLPDDVDTHIYIENNDSIIKQIVLPSPLISFANDDINNIPVFADNETIDYKYNVTNLNSTYKYPQLQPCQIYVFKYVDFSNYKLISSEQFIYYIQAMISNYYNSSDATINKDKLQGYINTLYESELTEEIYKSVMQEFSSFYTKGYFLLLGKPQIRAVYEVTDYNNPFNVNVIDTRLKVYTSEDKEQLTSDNLALQRAKWEAYKSTRFQYNLQLQTVLIPWLDVNKKFIYTSKSIEEKNEYLIKSISHDLNSWTTSITAIQYYPYYDETVNRG